MKAIVLGASGDITTCEACGKTNLKKTVVLEFADGSVKHYGCDCAGQALLGKKSATNTATVAKKVTLMEIIEKVRAARGTVKAICEAQGFSFDAAQNAFVRPDGLKVAA